MTCDHTPKHARDLCRRCYDQDRRERRLAGLTVRQAPTVPGGSVQITTRLHPVIADRLTSIAVRDRLTMSAAAAAVITHQLRNHP